MNKNDVIEVTEYLINLITNEKQVVHNASDDNIPLQI